MSTLALKRVLRPGGRSTQLIKGDVSQDKVDGLFPGYSASGQDVWLAEPAYTGPGLVLSAVGARCGKVFLAGGDWGVVANTAVLIPQPNCDPRFLWYLVNDENFWEKGGTAQPYIRVPETLGRRVWVPPLEEQRAIADYLDVETARIDSLIGKKQQLIHLLEERWHAVISRTFATEPAAETRRVAAYAEIVLGRQRSPQHETGEFMRKYLRAANVKAGFLDLEDVKEMNFTPQEAQRFELVPGDILVTEGSGSRSAVGASAVWNGEILGSVCFQNTLLRLRPRSGVDSSFLGWWAQFAHATGLFAEIAGGANIFHLSAERVRAVPMKKVSASEQKYVVRQLDDFSASSEAAIDALTAQISLIAEHRQALITAAVTGEFTVPGAA